MPYIKPKHKPQFKLEIKHLIDRIQEVDFGNLYYIIGSIVMKTIKPERYRQMLEVTGLLVNIRQEFMRRKDNPEIQHAASMLALPNFYSEDCKPAYDREIHALVRELRDGCGDIYGNLNYCITTLIVTIFEGQFKYCFPDIVRVLKQLNDDFYEQIMGPYEDLKIVENGDVY